MSTKELSFIIPTIMWNDLSSEEISSLYLYGALTPPSDLNDRIRPLVAENNQKTNEIGSGNYYDIVVKLDEISFVSKSYVTGVGPARFYNIAKIAFVQWFFAAEGELI